MKSSLAPAPRSRLRDPAIEARTPRAAVIGSLRDDVEVLAKALWRMLPYRPITVWINANADVLYHSASSAPEIDANWLAGTYDLNATPDDIASDLNSLKQERRATGMIDD